MNDKNLCGLLVKNRLMAQLGINAFRYEKDKRKRNGKIAITVAIFICLIMVIFYSAIVAYGYAFMGLGELIPTIALVICSLITLFFTMFKANGDLFGFKDYDLIMSLPVSVRTIINSRFINMYLWNTFITILVMLPMGIVYAVFTKPYFGFYIMWPVGILLASLIPTTIAAILGAIITAISSKFRYASTMATILSILLIVLLMVIPMTFTQSDSGIGSLIDSKTGNIDKTAFSAIAPIISGSLNRLYPPAKLFSSALVEHNIISFLLFGGISIGWYGLFVYLLSIKYKQINSALTSHISRADYKLVTLHQGSMRTALYVKTTKRILKSTICATNLLIGCVLSIMLAVAMVIAGPAKILQTLEISNSVAILNNTAGYVIAAMVCMTNTAAVSLALEGKNIWLIKSLPIAPKILYDSYLLTNLSFTVPTSFICSILFCISLKPGLIGGFLLIITPQVFAFFTAVMGIMVGNRLAYYDWQDEVQLIKQSMMTMIGILGGLAFVILCGALANTGIVPVSPGLLTFILDILLVVLTAVIYLKEANRPIRA